MSAGVRAIRRLGSWIDAFCQYTDIKASSPLYRKWAAISTIAAAMERKTWVRSKGSDLYPNLYMLLVGPPGIGKSAILAEVEKILRTLPDFHVAPSSVTTASLIDSIVSAKRRVVRPAEVPPYIEFNYLAVVASEFGVFLPGYDYGFMNALTKIYDNEFYEERRRGKDLHIKITHPALSIAGGTTPSYLNSLMPEGAWDQGFASRTIMIYSGEQSVSPLFDDENKHRHFEGVYKDLLNDIRVIFNLYGQFTWQPEAAAAITQWHMNGQPPVPDHSKLLHYNSRRTAHLLKLCMVASADTDADMVITIDHYQRALSWLIEAESFMPDIFKSMISGGDSRAIEDTWHFVWTTYAKETKPVAEHRIVHFLQQRVPAHSIMRVLQTMIQSGIIEAVHGFGGSNRTHYKPNPKATHGR